MSEHSIQLADVVVPASGGIAYSEPFAAFKFDGAWASQLATAAGAMTLTVELEMSYSLAGPWFAADLAETALGGGLNLAAASSPSTVFAAIADLGGSPYLRFKYTNDGAGPETTVSPVVGLGAMKLEEHLGLDSTGARLFDRLKGFSADVDVPTGATGADTSPAVSLAGYDHVALFYEGAAGAIVGGTVHLLVAAHRDGPYQEVASSGAGDADLAADFAVLPGQNYAKVRVKNAATAGVAKISLYGR